MNMIQAINAALNVMMARDEDIVVFGEDIGYFGGVFRATAGLQKQFGKTRVFDTPITEGGIIASRSAWRPTASPGARDPVRRLHLSRARPARQRGGAAALSLGRRVHRADGRSARPIGGGIFGGQTHSQSPEALFTHVAGLKTVIPSTPYDAKGLLIAAIEDNDPVDLLRAQAHLQRPVRRPLRPPGRSPGRSIPASEVPEGYYTVPTRQGGGRARGRRR